MTKDVTATSTYVMRSAANDPYTTNLAPAPEPVFAGGAVQVGNAALSITADDLNRFCRKFSPGENCRIPGRDYAAKA